MRDIRGDLQDRANLLQEQIGAVQGQFERHIEQLRREHEARLEDLKSALGTVRTVIGIESRLGRAMSAQVQAQAQAGPPSPSRPQQAQPQQPLSVIRKAS